jgi:hypothetical protein
MKNLLAVFICLAALKGYSQTSEAFVQEKSSAWIRVTENPVSIAKPEPIKKQTAVAKKSTTTNKPAKPKQNTQQEFEKTNSEVNRFKKQKNG